MNTYNFDLWTTECSIITDAPIEIAHEMLQLIDRACNRFAPSSEISQINAAAKNQDVYMRVSDILADFLAVAFHAREVSDRLVDPEVLPLLLAWESDSECEPVVRPRAFLDWSSDGPHVFLSRGSGLDLGATAKARAADLVAAALAARSEQGVMVSLGGDIAFAGQGHWVITVCDGLEEPSQEISVECGAGEHRGLGTSSSIRRRRGDLSHIFNPITQLPGADHWRTATVYADTCAEANTASTAAVVLGPEAVGHLERRYLAARLVDQNKQTYCTAGWPAEELMGV